MEIRATGAKYHFSLWIVYASTLWLLKASLLVLYMRLTTGLAGTYRVRILFGFGLLIASLAAVYLTVFLTCRPFGDYFDTVSPIVRSTLKPSISLQLACLVLTVTFPDECIPAVSRPIVWTCYAFNVITDLYLIALPLPMLFQTTMKTWKKVGLGVLFSGGAAIIVCATIRCVLLTTDPANGAPLSGNWGIREAFVAVITTNFPVVFTLIRGMLGPAFRSRNSSDPSKLKGGSSGNETGTELGTVGRSRRKSKKAMAGNGALTTQMLFTESEEKMVKEEGFEDEGISTQMPVPALAPDHGRGYQRYADVERSAGARYTVR